MCGGTGARFNMPIKTPHFLCSLAFCQWYHSCNTESLDFKINQSGVKLIQGRICTKKQGYHNGQSSRILGAEEYQVESESSGESDYILPEDEQPVE